MDYKLSEVVTLAEAAADRGLTRTALNARYATAEAIGKRVPRPVAYRFGVNLYHRSELEQVWPITGSEQRTALAFQAYDAETPPVQAQVARQQLRELGSA